jgi:hypothetical protein
MVTADADSGEQWCARVHHAYLTIAAHPALRALVGDGQPWHEVPFTMLEIRRQETEQIGGLVVRQFHKQPDQLLIRQRLDQFEGLLFLDIHQRGGRLAPGE